MNDETRPAPAWAGDVSAGVEAWTRGRAVGSDDEGVSSGGRSASRRGQGRGRRGQGRGGSAGSGLGSRRAAPPPEDTATAVPHADPESVARTILLDQLTGRARSRKELSDKLASRDVPDDVATRVLDRFEEVGLIDDEAFARTWVAQRGPGGVGRSLARRALSQELRRKGIDQEVAAVVLDEVEPADEEDAARVLVRKKLRSLSRVDHVTATRRLVGMLARKGYPSGVAFTVVREELAQARDERSDDLGDLEPDL